MRLNSTIALEGIVRWLQWDGYQLDDMIDRVFEVMDTPSPDASLLIEVQPDIMGV